MEPVDYYWKLIEVDDLKDQCSHTVIETLKGLPDMAHSMLQKNSDFCDQMTMVS